ncbi:MAG: aminotransferase class V-fold PLP-dependent enzyme [Ktedonobacterales bacterium]|nr:aminotransferase class V-fold PLP-dependent enzyme [Ktedonobacterales bacterium]
MADNVRMHPLTDEKLYAGLPPLEPMLRRIVAVCDTTCARNLARLEHAEALRVALFPVARQYAYLNHASVCAPPLPITRAVSRFLEAVGRCGSMAYDHYASEEASVRARFARLIGAAPDAIALAKNVSDALMMVASGLNWYPGQNIVTGEGEFPANVYPWLNLRERGVEVRIVPSRGGRLSLDDIAARIDARTRLVTLSFVEFGSGQRHDLAAAAALAHTHGALFGVDGVQGVGALRLDVAASAIDFLACASPKWLLGPSYAGLLYIRPALLHRLRAIPHGWTSVRAPEHLTDFAQPLRADAARLECGTNSLTALVGLGAALDLLEAAGMEDVERRVLGLAALVRAGLAARQHEILSPHGPNEHSGIVCFRPRFRPSVSGTPSAERLVIALAEHSGVVVSARQGCVRVSPHFYNTPEEIARFHVALDEVLA